MRDGLGQRSGRDDGLVPSPSVSLRVTVRRSARPSICVCADVKTNSDSDESVAFVHKCE